MEISDSYTTAAHWLKILNRTTPVIHAGGAAKAAYNRALPQFRVLFVLQENTTFSHCCFTDHGCMQVCPCEADDNNDSTSRDLHASVGTSIRWFLQALHSKEPFSQHQFPAARLPRLSPQQVKVILDDNIRMVEK